MQGNRLNRTRVINRGCLPSLANLHSPVREFYPHLPLVSLSIYFESTTRNRADLMRPILSGGVEKETRIEKGEELSCEKSRRSCSSTRRIKEEKAAGNRR